MPFLPFDTMPVLRSADTLPLEVPTARPQSEEKVRRRKTPEQTQSELSDTTLLPSSSEVAKPHALSARLALPLSVLIGLCFGVALEKGRVFDPEVLIGTMELKNFTMLKMFLTATSTSMIVLGAMHLTSLKARVDHVRQQDLFASPRSMWPVILGAFMLGSGMTLAGACPGTVMVQLGAGPYKWVGVTLAGGFLGALVYGLIAPKIDGFLWDVSRPRKVTADTLINKPFWLTAMLMATVMLTAVALLEYFLPYKEELDLSHSDQESSNVLTWLAWPPYVSGAIIGLLQLPVLVVALDTLGSSQTFVVGVSNLLHVLAPKYLSRNPYFSAFRTGVQNVWQVFYMGGAVLGAAGSSLLSDSWNATHNPRPWWLCLIGGFSIIFGARLAGGCTSGHGISGAAMLSLHSFLAIGAMFGGGILWAQLGWW